MNRRKFIKHGRDLFLGASALSGFASFLPGCFVVSKEAFLGLPHFFMVIRVIGGMDSHLGLNPWLGERPDPRDLFLDDDFVAEEKVSGTEISLGPSALSLKPHVGNLAIINGVFMGTVDVGHPPAMNYITTAKSNPKSPHFIAEVAECFRQYRKDRREAILFNGALNTFDLDQLTRLPVQMLALQQESTVATEDQPRGEGFYDLSRSRSTFELARQSLANGAQKKSQVLLRIKQLASQVGDVLPEQSAAVAFSADYARFAQIDWDMRYVLDNHRDYVKVHQHSQRKIWERVSNLLTLLKSIDYQNSGVPLFPDLVTIIVLNEFSRLPFLNSNKGKEHNFFDNSILVGGRGIRGGTQLGGHSLFLRDGRRVESQVSGCHIDYRTGRLVRNGYYNTAIIEGIAEEESICLIRPENILRTLGDVFHVDYDFMRLFSKNTKPLPKILRV